MTTVMLVVGFVGSMVIGYILDVTKRYKLITVLNTSIFCISYILFTIFVSRGNGLKCKGGMSIKSG